MAGGKCEIYLHQKPAIYFPTDTVTGNVKITIKSATNISRIELYLIGEAHFTVQPFKVYEEKKNLEINRIFHAGHEIFGMTWTLPESLIPSYKWRFGHVNYYFFAKVEVKGKHGFESTHVPLLIQNSIDLTKLPLELSNVTEYNAAYTNQNWGTALLRLVMNRRCFVPGEWVKFNVALEQVNLIVDDDITTTTRDLQWRILRGISVSVEEEMMYRKDGYERYKTAKVMGKSGVSATAITRICSDTMWEDGIKIPSNCGTTPGTFSQGAVGFRYFLIVTVQITSPRLSQTERGKIVLFRIPIVIGGIALELPSLSDSQMNVVTMRRISLRQSYDGTRVGNWVILTNSGIREEDPREEDEQVFLGHHMEGNVSDEALLDFVHPPPSYEESISMEQPGSGRGRVETPPPSYISSQEKEPTDLPNYAESDRDI